MLWRKAAPPSLPRRAGLGDHPSLPRLLPPEPGTGQARRPARPPRSAPDARPALLPSPPLPSAVRLFTR